MDSVKLLKELMKIDSSTKEKANEAIEFCSEYLKTNGIDGEIIENRGYKSYVAVIGEGEKTLVFNGHLDVVSAKESQFTPIEKDGKIIGRGSADMKSGVVAIMHALIELKNQDLKSKVMLQLVSDEEIGGLRCSGFLVEEGYLGDFVICTEPTNLNVSLQSKGIIRMDITTKGISAHGSRPWEGDNAIVKSIDNHKKITELPIMNIGSEFYDKSTSNLAWIKGGDIYNRVPDECVMGLDIRFVPSVNPEEIVEEIKKVVDGEVKLKIIEPGVFVASDNQYVKELSQVVKENLDVKIKFTGQHGGSDARFFAAKGIPAVEFGPTGNFWHGDDEYVEIDSIYQLEKVLIDFAKKF